jgi:hypothetical protein
MELPTRAATAATITSNSTRNIRSATTHEHLLKLYKNNNTSSSTNKKEFCEKNYDNEYKNYLKKIYEIFKMNGHYPNGDENLNVKKTNSNSLMNEAAFSLYYLSANEKENDNRIQQQNQSKNDEIKNYFLTYRSIVKKESDNNVNINCAHNTNNLKPIINLDNNNNNNNNNNNQINCNELNAKLNNNLAIENNKKIESQQLTNRSNSNSRTGITATTNISQAVSLLKATNMLEEHRRRNGPEKYLEPLKIIDIKKWIEQVEQVHNVEGKYLETINKCRYYDD